MRFLLLAMLAVAGHWGCVFNSAEGNRGASTSVSESKKRGVFVAEMLPTKSIFVYSGPISIGVESAWVERKWWFSNKPDGVQIDSGYQLIVVTDSSDLVGTGFSVDWTIGTSSDRYFRPCGARCIMTDLVAPPEVLESWIVRRGFKLGRDQPVDSIGVFELMRK